MIVIKAVQLEGFAILGPPGSADGQYLESFDIDAFDGWGHAVWTDDKANAKAFKDLSEALTYWKQESRLTPIRPDGQPNRPLTAFTITFERTEDA